MVCISLMVLLTMLAVGLLGLSSITLRRSNGSAAMAEARANARLALMLALNDLQVHAGPDTRITAPAGTLGDSVAREELTGVWSARALDPENPDQTGDLDDSAKADDFRRWLVSSTEPEETARQEFATGGNAEGEVLLSRRYSADGTSDFLAESVGVIDPRDEEVGGRYAYAVFDEGAKARVNLGVQPSREALATRTEQLGGGQRPGVDRISELAYADDQDVDLTTPEGAGLVAKMVTLASAEMGHQANRASYNPHFHALTPYSLGLLTDVSHGGFKYDLNLLADSDTPRPAEFEEGHGIYETMLDLDLASDPDWNLPLTFAGLYEARNSRRRPYINSTGDVPTLTADAPRNWSASSAVSGNIAVPNPEPPPSPVLLPSIAKLQMVYSLHVHDIFRFPASPVPLATHFHNGPFTAEWKGKNRWDDNWSTKNVNRAINYQMWVFCTPIVTLHNPYNVALVFEPGDLKIDFVNVPFAMRIFVNDTPQTQELVPYTDMFYWNDKGNERRYTMNLNNKSVSGSNIGVDTGSDIRLLPGEVKVFSPYMNPNAKYFDTSADWYNVYNRNTQGIQAIPGWLGEGIGYAQDQPLPAKYNPLRLTNDSQGRITGNGRMMQDGMALTGDELIHVEFAPVAPDDEPEKRFTIEMTLDGANSSSSARSCVLDFEYETSEGLQQVLLGDNGVIRYPEQGAIQASELRDHWDTPLSGFRNIKPFALLSAYAKTTFGGVDESNEDGRYPAKPWVFNNHAGAVGAQNVVAEHPAHHAHEINLVRLPGHTEEAIDIQPYTDRGNFVTGHTVFNGRRFGTMLEIPLGPLQSPVTLNGANLAAGYYLPRFTAPIGNSFAHPVMSSNALLEQVNGETYADHCYLLNSVFYERFFCSGLQARGGRFGDGLSARELGESFFTEGGLLPDARFIPYLADGRSADDIVGEIDSDEGYRKAGAYQLLRGAFNVNSTSVEAWKAVLSSMKGESAAVSAIPLNGGNSDSESLETLDEPDDGNGARFSRFRLPNAQPSEGDPDALWHAPRDLSEEQLDDLATEIVEQVRERGPFLSLTEFVNRRIGPASDLSRVGALQAAIEESGINDDEVDLGGYDIDGSRLADLELRNPDALLGPSAQAAPAALCQADILSLLGNSVTVRSDTFLVRGYGASVNADGDVEARAWCEAVVQRLPEFVDPVDPATTAPEDLRETNQRFGRRFHLVSFRWLNPEEV